MLKKVDNWRTLLTAHINDHREDYFEWGTHDCALWAANCILIETGVDFAKDIRGTYTTPEGAYKQIIKVFKCHQITEIFQKVFGDEIHVSACLPGDVVFKRSNMGGFDAIVGICNGKASHFVTELEGLRHIPTLECDGGYRV